MAARPLVAQRDTARFRILSPETVTGDPTGLHFAPKPRVAPIYPAEARQKNVAATPVVAFVVDTTGRVEARTAAFLNDTPKEFQQSVCDMLPDLRFIPLTVGGVKQRVLFVEPVTFQTLVQEDTTWHSAKALADKQQEVFATQPVDQSIPYLASRPHCE